MRCLFLRVILKLRLQVNTKLKAATVKLKKTREERDQFDEASNQIVLHLKTKVNFLLVSSLYELKTHYGSTVFTSLFLFSGISLPQEDELSRSLASCKVEASTVSAWISFLEDTWKLQSLFEELKEKQAKYVGSLPERHILITNNHAQIL